MEETDLPGSESARPASPHSNLRRVHLTLDAPTGKGTPWPGESHAYIRASMHTSRRSKVLLSQRKANGRADAHCTDAPDTATPTPDSGR